MQWCDRNPNILEWNSECIIIRYYDPVERKHRRYFPDFYVKVRENSGKIVEKLIEVKPLKQTTPPTKPKRKTKGYIYEVREYAKNMAKWEAGTEFCKDRSWKFQVLTEKELGIKK